jgi:hypothetical protein
MISGMNAKTDASLTPDPALAQVCDELVKREPIFHRPELGTSQADYEKMTVADFWEVGASGRAYSRAPVLAELERRRLNPSVDTWETLDCRCRRLASDVYLLTNTLVQDGIRTTRRSTIWQHTEEGWKIVVHQGTIVQEP